jgi:Restriction endonuclease S subunits
VRQRYLKVKTSGVDWFGEVPAHWGVERLKNSARCWVSNVDKVPSEEEVPVRLCNYTDVYYKERIHPGLELMQTTATPEEIQRFGLRVNDVVITKDSEEWNDIAVPALVIESASDLVCGYHLGIIRPDNKRLLGSFLLRAFQSCAINQQFQMAATGVTRYGLPKSSIGDAWIPIPPYYEQVAIAAFLGHKTAEIDALVAKKRLLIEKLKEKRSALISRIVTRGLPLAAAKAAGLNPKPKFRPSQIEWLRDVPEHWEVKQLRYVGDAIIGLTYEPADVVDEREGILVLRASNVSEGRIVLDDTVFVNKKIPARLLTRIGDILICSRSGSRDLIGKNARIDEHSAGLCFGTFMTVFRSNCSEYLFYVFNSTLFEYQSAAFLTSTINQLTISNLYSFEVPMPPLRERLAIVDFLDRETAKIDALIAKVKQAIERLQEYRTALITAAVTGKIDVRQEQFVESSQRLSSSGNSACGAGK